MTENTLPSPRRDTEAVALRAWREVDTRLATVFLVASVAIAALVLGANLDQGWVHHDDGSLAQSAERVLGGELPHRDFAELYTGLLTFVNAGLFALLGEDLLNLRYPLFVLFLGFVASYYLLALRLVSRWLAFAATLFAITWSVPVYPAPMPSWYLLFLSTIGLYAAVRYIEGGASRWLLAAGACGGLAITIKVVAVWYVIAVLLALLAAPLVTGQRIGGSNRPVRFEGYMLASSAVLALLLVVTLISRRPSAGTVAALVVPLATVCVVVAHLGLRSWSTTATTRASVRAIGTYLGGVTIPIALLALPYIATRSVGDLIEGTLIAPGSRFTYAAHDMPYPTSFAWAAPAVALFYLRSRTGVKSRQVIGVVGASVIAFLVLTAATQPAYSILWETTRALAPVLVVIGAIAIHRTAAASSSAELSLAVLFVLAGAFSVLLQFPFSTPIYFCYVVPVVLLAGLAVIQRTDKTSGLLPAAILIGLAVFGFRQLDDQTIATLGRYYEKDPQVAVLYPGRASIRVTPAVKRHYDRVRYLVAEHRVGTEFIYAGPDAPEVYFLTDSRNPTRSIIDFLDISRSASPENLVRLLEARAIPVVVINHAPQQSSPLDRSSIMRIRTLYPRGEAVGNLEVRWHSSSQTH